MADYTQTQMQIHKELVKYLAKFLSAQFHTKIYLEIKTIEIDFNR